MLKIAKHCGVSNNIVSERRKSLSPVKSLSSDDSRVGTGRDGRTINTTNIGRKPEPTKPAPIVEVAEAVEVYGSPTPEAPEPVVPELERLDAKGTEIALRRVEARRAIKAKRRALLDLVDKFIARAAERGTHP
jgi:hypothetical protein